MKRSIHTGLLASMLLFSFFFAPLASAQGILPAASNKCVRGENSNVVKALKDQSSFDNYVNNSDAELTPDTRRGRISNALGCAIKLGKIHLFMMPLFVVFLIEFLLGLAGLVSVLFIIVGGYHYVVGGLIEDKESGKKYIQNALLGLLVSLGAWMIVNFVQILLTS